MTNAETKTKGTATTNRVCQCSAGFRLDDSGAACVQNVCGCAAQRDRTDMGLDRAQHGRVDALLARGDRRH